MSSIEELHSRVAALQAQLAAAEEILAAIQQGKVDAVVVHCPNGDQVFTLEGADHPYRVLVEQMREGTLTLDSNGLILFANQRFAGMLGVDIDSVVGSRVGSYLAPESQSLFAALLESTSGRHERAEVVFQTASGGNLPAMVSLNHLDFGDGRYVSAVVTDLTERRRNEAIVREEQLSRLMLEQAAEAIVVIDASGHILRASESAQKLAGRNVLLQPFDEVFPIEWPEPQTPFHAAYLLDAAKRGSLMRGVEVSLARASGPAALLLSAGALWGADGELIGCVVTLTDITQRKLDEQALARQARELARSNSDLRQFAYSASHDLREPLRVVSLYTQLVRDRLAAGSDAVRPFLDQVISASQRMDGQLRDLLAYVQACERPEETVACTDAESALDKALDSLHPVIREQQARIERSALPVLQIHPVHLEQLFQNLISNALKYRGERAPVVSISGCRAGQLWRLSVSDNGIGIAPRYQNQIFGLFKRLHTRTEYDGTGIGLAICQRIVERYGGTIWVDSEEGKGSTFHFTAPGAERTGWEASAS